MPGGLEDSLWGEYSKLQKTLVSNGYPQLREVSGFSIYRLQPKGNTGNIPGMFFAIRESKYNPNTIEKALLWEATSLEDAVATLSSVPLREGEKKDLSREDRMLHRITAGLLLAGGALVGYSAGDDTAGKIFHAMVGAAVGGIAYLSVCFTLQKLNNYLQWLKAREGFSNLVYGKQALARALELTEIVMA